jgi:hypothetical protein
LEHWSHINTYIGPKWLKYKVTNGKGFIPYRGGWTNANPKGNGSGNHIYLQFLDSNNIVKLEISYLPGIKGETYIQPSKYQLHRE